MTQTKSFTDAIDTGSTALRALAVGAFALGAAAIGAIAVGAMNQTKIGGWKMSGRSEKIVYKAS
jgi:hypothetical protein